MDRIEEIRERIEDGERHFDYVEVTYLLSVIEEKDRIIEHLNAYAIAVGDAEQRAEQAESDKDFTQSKLRVTKDVLDNVKKQLEQAEERCAELTAYGHEVIDLQRKLVVANEKIKELEKERSILTEGELTSLEIFRRNASLIKRIADLQSQLAESQARCAELDKAYGRVVNNQANIMRDFYNEADKDRIADLESRLSIAREGLEEIQYLVRTYSSSAFLVPEILNRIQQTLERMKGE